MGAVSESAERFYLDWRALRTWLLLATLITIAAMAGYLAFFWSRLAALLPWQLLLLLPGSAVVAYALAAIALRAFVRRHPVVVQREGISVWWPLRGKTITPWHLIVSARSARRWRASDLVLQIQGSRWPGRIPMPLERPREFAAAVARHAGSQHPLTAVLRERTALHGASPAHDLS